MRLTLILCLVCAVALARDLSQVQVVKHSDNHFTFDKARLILRNGVRVLHLRGTDYEMAYQHGALLKNDVLKGAVPQSAQLIDRTIDNSFGTSKTAASFAKAYVRKLITNKMIDHNIKTGAGTVGAAQIEAAKGLAQATGIKLNTLYEAMFAPDVLMILAAQPPMNELKVAPISSCSDFAAWGSYTHNGEMIIGRNLDYPLNGFFDAYPTILYFDPVEEGAQRYIAVTSAGVHNAGLTAINESGIFIGAHTVPTTDVSKTGRPAFVVVGEIVRLARTFDEVIQKFKAQLPATGYAYTIVSTKEKRVATIEISAQHVVVREVSTEVYAQANHYRTEEMKPHYMHINKSVDMDTFARLARIEQLLEVSKGTLDAKSAMKILGDGFDPYAKTDKGHGNTVAVHTTMSSVVVLPESQKIYVANGLAPTSQTSFVELPLFGEWNLEKWLDQEYETIENSFFKSKNPSISQALQYFIQAKKFYELENDPKASLEWMRRAAEMDSYAGYQFMRGILALKSKADAEAETAFSAVQAQETQAGLLSRYYLGRIRSDQGKKDEACALYESVALSSEAGQLLKEAAIAACEKTKTLTGYKINPNKLRIYMQQGDMVSYE